MKSDLTCSPVSNKETKDGSIIYNDHSPIDFALTDSRHYRHQLQELRDKFRKVMIENAQMDNEKHVYKYQVESLKENLDELENEFQRLLKNFKEKSRLYELLKIDHEKLKQNCFYLKCCLKQRNTLIKDHGFVLFFGSQTLADNSNSINAFLDGCDHEIVVDSTLNYNFPPSNLKNGALISTDLINILNSIEGSTMECKLKNVIQEQIDLLSENEQLRGQLNEIKEINFKIEQSLGNHAVKEDDLEVIESERENSKLFYDYKFELKKAEQEINNFQSNMSRLETQLVRYKLEAEETEKITEDLKTEKRKVLRELRDAQVRIEELETSNEYLQKRLEKMKNNRLAVINS